MKHLLISSTFYFLCISHAAANCLTEYQSSQLGEEIRTLVTNTIKENSLIPGISLFVESEALCFKWHEAVGVSDFQSKQKLSKDHTYRIASNTKTYTAATVLRLVEQGQIKLDNTISDYLPQEYIEILNKKVNNLEDLTIRSLLTHMSGLPDHTRDKRYFASILSNPLYQWSAKEQVNLLNTYDMKIDQPGNTFQYSDTGYVLLGTIIEHVTNMKMFAAFQQYLNFEKLGLSDTHHENPQQNKKSPILRAHQYLQESDTYHWNPSLDLFGGGGLITTSEDMAVFTRALLRGKIFKNEDTLTTMKNVLSQPNEMNYGMGLFWKKFDSNIAWGHTGFWNTFSYYLPEIDLVIAGSIMQTEAIKGTDLAKEITNLVTHHAP